MLGYTVSLSGMVLYKEFKKDPAALSASLVRVVDCMTLGLFTPANLEFLFGTTTYQRVNSSRAVEMMDGSEKHTSDGLFVDISAAFLDQRRVLRTP